ncbi:MAG: hypothetical protein NPIRA04_17890 [Nitrospirales bacterium]|nr:MAG: hypothetical protein NPIRA04_17890 [Nitrospirales bacterium]
MEEGILYIYVRLDFIGLNGKVMFYKAYETSYTGERLNDELLGVHAGEYFCRCLPKGAFEL